MHDRAAILESDLVHHCPHEVNATSVSGHPAFGDSWIRDRAAVKPLSLVANRDVDRTVRSAAAGDLNLLFRILAVAVDDGIGEGFMQRRLDVKFGSVRGTAGRNQRHEPFDKGRNGRHVAR